MEQTSKWNDFTQVRSNFEELLLANDFLIQQITRKHRTPGAGYEQIKELFVHSMTKLLEGNSQEDVVKGIYELDEFDYLNTLQDASIITSSVFSVNRKSAVFIREAIKSAPKCQICSGYIHKNSITIDHKTRRSEGGLGSVDNGQIAHPYCNTTFKH